MIIQWVILILVLFMYFKLLMDLKKGRISLRRFFFWLFIWTGLSLITYFPQIVFFFSNLIGIERAKDLPIYVSIILLFYLLFKISIRIEEIEQGITKIVKKIALGVKE
ncbi:MAG: DUF2304 domain-containing protein [Candidatus Pacearchaeota archaeon]